MQEDGIQTGSCNQRRQNSSDYLVVEDAVSGIEAGKAAGCRCLAVTSSFDSAELKDADWICDSLLNVPEEVLNW